MRKITLSKNNLPSRFLVAPHLSSFLSLSLSFSLSFSFMSGHKAHHEPDSEWDNLEFHAGFGTLKKEKKDERPRQASERQTNRKKGKSLIE
jgi:hypothetical protein